MGGPRITCVVRATSVTECIELEYIGNFITGHAHWRLDPRDQGTQVSYVLDVHVHGLLGALISRFINLQPIHSFSMRNILKELEQQVKQHSAQTF
jgi:carbon monoxide dehydrogenase subunit G